MKLVTWGSFTVTLSEIETIRGFWAQEYRSFSFFKKKKSMIISFFMWKVGWTESSWDIWITQVRDDGHLDRGVAMRWWEVFRFHIYFEGGVDRIFSCIDYGLWQKEKRMTKGLAWFSKWVAVNWSGYNCGRGRFGLSISREA